MSFNSLYFILIFLPAVLLLYYLAAAERAEAADWILVGASAVFYGFANAWYPLLLGILLAVNWGITLRIRKRRAAPVGQEYPAARRWMVFGVIFNVAVLAVFKYANFFIENLNALLQSDWPLVNLILPLGISFIIFGQISWIVDAYRGSTEDVCLREYVLFSSFFPKLSQGPITLARDFIPQLRKEGRQRFSYEGMMIGIQMFVLGLGKKILIADVLGTAVDWYFDTITFRTNLDSLIVVLTYTLQIYFDFSGYSDMALGVSKMLGFDLPANFDSPYKACTVTEFWKRWHISLTTFLREYIYFPLGGSRKGAARTYRNVMIVYLISGFWHGASWTYVLWGIVHGAAQCAERALGQFYGSVLKPAAERLTPAGSEAGTGRFCRRVWKCVRWGITFAFVNLAWMLFRCGDLATWKRFWWHLTVDRVGTISPDLAENYRISGLRLVCSLLHLPTGDAFVNLLSMGILLAAGVLMCLLLPNNQRRRYRSSVLSLLVTAGLLAVCLLSMSSVSSFVYNDF